MKTALHTIMSALGFGQNTRQGFKGIAHLSGARSGSHGEATLGHNKDISGLMASLDIGPIDFETMLAGLRVETDYSALSADDITCALVIAMMGVGAASMTHYTIGALERQALAMHRLIKAKSTGGTPESRRDNRQIRAPDNIFNLGYRFPERFWFDGEHVGGQSLYALLLDNLNGLLPGSCRLARHYLAITPLLNHHLNMPTAEAGLPQAFQSFFAYWTENPGFLTMLRAGDPLMDRIEREHGTHVASDISSWQIIQRSLKGYESWCYNHLGSTREDRSLHKAQMSTLVYGAATLVQLMRVISGRRSDADWPHDPCSRRVNGRLNQLVTCPFAFNATRNALIEAAQQRPGGSRHQRALACLDDRERRLNNGILML